MDHKKFFQKFGDLWVRHSAESYTAEELYQAIKLRFFEEISIQDFARFLAVKDGKPIDSTDQEASRG